MDIKQLKTIKQNFVQELQDASLGKKTSLPFIVHKLSPSSIVKDGEMFQAMVIGGSVFKKALLRQTANGMEVLKKEDEKQLSIKNESDFLSFIDQELDYEASTLALNFAYPIKPLFENGRLDGVLLAVTKEGSFHGLVGKKIAEEIEEYILKKRNKKIIVSVANDTICLLLSGLTEYSLENLAAGIVGTGLNFAFFLREDKLVNLESANFDKFPRSEEVKLIDRQSAKPGKALFEKETAGAYLYKHFNIAIKENDIDYSHISSTEELDIVSHKNINGVSEIARSLLKRSAQLVACQIAGITGFKKGRHSGKRTDSRISNHDERFWTSQNDKNDEGMTFNMEGSLFWKGNNYKETVEETLKLLVPKYNVKFVELEESGILGAAKLVA